ncbi:MAG TPA: hypothetical protein VGN14_11170 [Candidatus Elarobacter sp.]
MRGLRVLSLLAAFVALAACGEQHRAATTATAVNPAPKDADLTPVVERFYQLVEGGHWPIAYRMFSERWRAQHTQGALEAMYHGAANADVQVRQSSGRTTVAAVTLPAHDGAPARAWRETLTFRWDGTDWTIDGIAR